ALPGARDLALLHGLEERGLRLRRRAVDLVGEDEVREDRPGRELEEALAGRLVLGDDLGAGDVARHEVRRELDARELEREDLRERGDEQRLREPGDADEQAVPAREERHEELVDHVPHADDLLVELAPDLPGRLAELLDLLALEGADFDVVAQNSIP